MMFRSILTVCLVLSLAAGCKDDKELDEIPAPSAEQIAAAKKKAAERKAKAKDAKDTKGKDVKKPASKAKVQDPQAKTEADKKAAEAEAKAGKPGDKVADTAAARAEKRKKRLADLKKRSEERRKERLERLKKRKETAKARATGGAAGAATTAAAAAAAKRDGKAPNSAATPLSKKPNPRDKKRPPAPTVKSSSKDDAKAARAAAAEAKAAVAAAARPAPVASLGTPANALRITKYMTLADVKEVTGKSNIVEGGSLAGIPASARYNSALYTLGKADFAASIQVWKEVTQRAADQRFRRMQKDYPNAEATDAVSAKGFFAAWGEMMTLVFFEPFKRTLVAVTCSDKVCTQASLLALAKRVKTQM